MPRIPIFRLGAAPDKPGPPKLAVSTPVISLEGLTVGVDNLRHDVRLSPKFLELGRAQIARLIARHGELEGLLSADVRPAQGPSWLRNLASRPGQTKNDPGAWRSAVAELQVA
jgi:hypothetical protein